MKSGLLRHRNLVRVIQRLRVALQGLQLPEHVVEAFDLELHNAVLRCGASWNLRCFFGATRQLTLRPERRQRAHQVSLDRSVVTFRPNAWRRLKTSTSHRSVPLWPQLRAILERYLAERPPGRLLFPSYCTGEEAMVTDFRKALDALAVRAGWKPGEIRSKIFRHTYCAARLQTLDQGAPVSVFTVARELGHGGETMVRKVYGHLGQVRHRSEAVEYRVEQHVARLGVRLEALRGVGFGTTIGTTA